MRNRRHAAAAALVIAMLTITAAAATAGWQDVLSEVAKTLKTSSALSDADSAARKIPFVADRLRFDLDAYVTAHALDGIFLMVAREERLLRENPQARSTELLEKVFGAARTR